MLTFGDIYTVYCDVDTTSICYPVFTEIILNSVVFNILKNKNTYNKVFFEEKSFANCKAAVSVVPKNDCDIQTQNMGFPIRHLLREHNSFALYSLSTGTSQITNNFSFIFFDLFTTVILWVKI